MSPNVFAKYVAWELSVIADYVDLSERHRYIGQGVNRRVIQYAGKSELFQTSVTFL